MSSMHFTSMLFFAAIFPAFAPAQPQANVPAIREIPGLTPEPGIFRAASREKPLVLNSEKAAAKYFSGKHLDGLVKLVDFEKQIVLVFAWRGSGQDRLDFAVQESFPEQVVFSYQPGRTKDLRPHVRVYALRSNVKWKTAAGVGPRPAASDSIKVEIRGTLDSQVFAIGGETTGVTITANGITWELSFAPGSPLRKTAQDFHQQKVLVTGQLTTKQGVERGRRYIVNVATLERGTGKENSQNSHAYLNDKRLLKHPLVLRDSQSGFAGETGTLWTIEPEGNWRRQTFLNNTVREADQSGQISRTLLHVLAHDLKSAGLLELPNEIGKAPGVNPHVVSITFGQKTVAMRLPAGAALPKPDPQNPNSDEQRFAAAVRAIQTTVDSKANTRR